MLCVVRVNTGAEPASRYLWRRPSFPARCEASCSQTLAAVKAPGRPSHWLVAPQSPVILPVAVLQSWQQCCSASQCNSVGSPGRAAALCTHTRPPACCCLLAKPGIVFTVRHSGLASPAEHRAVAGVLPELGRGEGRAESGRGFATPGGVGRHQGGVAGGAAAVWPAAAAMEGEERPHSCSACHKRYLRKNNLEDHVLMEHPESEQVGKQ